MSEQVLHSPALTWLEFARQCVSGLGVLHLPQAPDLKMPSTRPHCCANPRYCAYPCSVPLHSTLPAPSQIHPPPPAPCLTSPSLLPASPHPACPLCLTLLPLPGLAPAAALPPSLLLVSHPAPCAWPGPCCCPPTKPAPCVTLPCCCLFHPAMLLPCRCASPREITVSAWGVAAREVHGGGLYGKCMEDGCMRSAWGVQVLCHRRDCCSHEQFAHTACHTTCADCVGSALGCKTGTQTALNK